MVSARQRSGASLKRRQPNRRPRAHRGAGPFFLSWRRGIVVRMSPAHHHRVLDIALGIALGGVIVLAVDAWFLREGIHTVDRAVAALQHSQHADAAPAAAAAHDELAAIVAHDAVAERWFQANIERIDHQLQIVAETCGRARPPAPLFKLPPRPGARPRLSPWGLATVAAP